MEDCSKTERRQLAALAGVTEALTGLANRIRARGAMSDDFIRLTGRARAIAQQARDVQTSRWAFEENATRLADSIAAFANEVQAAADRTVAAMAGDAGVVDMLLSHAERIAHLRDADAGSPRQLEIRAELAPLETTLVALQARIGEERRVSLDAATLAKEATALATRALGLRHGGRMAEVAAYAIHGALIAFVEDATTVSHRIEQSAQGLGGEAARITPVTRPPERPRVEPFHPGLVRSG